MTLPLFDLHAQHTSIRGEIDRALTGVIQHGRFINGPEVEEFEQAFAGYCGATACVGTSNGTSAIELVLRAAGIGAGDEVITTTMTFIATVEPIVLVGARPILVDIDPDTALLAVDAVEAAISERTAALMPVHLYGQPVDLDAFRALADRHKLLLIEDAAQAHGASWRGQRVGTVGDVATFSFFPGKNLGALGDAGAVVTSDAGLAGDVRRLRDHGRIGKYEHDQIGTNARLDTVQAAVLIAKLEFLDQWNTARRHHADAYDEAFADIEAVTPIHVSEDANAVYHQYVVRVQARDEVRALLEARGISSGVHYPIPLHRQPALTGYVEAEYPVADDLARTVLSLPMFPELSTEQLDRVVTAVSDSVAESAVAHANS
jgi:dTDP-4-amino-4,6-dideoxygalactose transaminase